MSINLRTRNGDEKASTFNRSGVENDVFYLNIGFTRNGQ
jgi:hypothetical protein